jgi:UDP-N-acetylglucosamine 2-epimerase (non-hydrolysing)
MKIMTVLGTRPEIIRLSRVIPLLDQLCEHRLVHTGQNFDPNLSDIFFQQLGIRSPDDYLDVRADSMGKQIGEILSRGEQILLTHKPDRLLLLGDTNSALIAIVAKRLGIPVFHMEAGNRCYDDRVPEETNRRIIDHCSSILMPYTERSRENLLREGIPSQNIYVTGNPIFEVLQYYEDAMKATTIMSTLAVEPRGYFLVTVHRAENVDNKDRLEKLVNGLKALYMKYKLPIICSLHPRTKSKLLQFGLEVEEHNLRFCEPLSFFDFVTLERNAFCVLSDSGTVQEECAIFKVPNVTLRDVTERPETLECGSNMLSGVETDSIMSCVNTVVSQPHTWIAPFEYTVEDVRSKIAKMLLGYIHRG